MNALLFTVAVACFVLAGIGLVGSAILFKTLRIWDVFGELSGRTANNAIAKLREQGNFKAHRGRSLQSIIYGTGDGSVDFAVMDGQAGVQAHYAGRQAAAQANYVSGQLVYSGGLVAANSHPRTGNQELTEAQTVVLDRGSESVTELLASNTEAGTELLSPNTESATELLAAHSPHTTGEPHSLHI